MQSQNAPNRQMAGRSRILNAAPLSKQLKPGFRLAMKHPGFFTATLELLKSAHAFAEYYAVSAVEELRDASRTRAT